MTKNVTTHGPEIYKNWIAMNDHEECKYSYEYPLYSNVHIIGEDKYGPYELINNVPPLKNKNLDYLIPAITLRTNIFVSEKLGKINFNDKNTINYHGGLLQDEVASLISISLGIRIRAGNYNRSFNLLNKDIKGRPHMNSFEIYWIDHLFEKMMLDNTNNQFQIASINLIKKFIILSPEDASLLIKTSRLYQKALFMYESDPSICWVMLTSAIETLATQKIKKGKLHTKFVNFIINNNPEQPKKRPPQYCCIDWNNLEKYLEYIYDCRSRFLHNGIPFPYPMLSNIYKVTDSLFAEKPLGGGSAALGGIWTKKDTEVMMHLHVFEYIVRHTINNWVSSLIPK